MTNSFDEHEIVTGETTLTNRKICEDGILESADGESTQA
jgi:hypothetical protein